MRSPYSVTVKYKGNSKDRAFQYFICRVFGEMVRGCWVMWLWLSFVLTKPSTFLAALDQLPSSRTALPACLKQSFKASPSSLKFIKDFRTPLGLINRKMSLVGRQTQVMWHFQNAPVSSVSQSSFKKKNYDRCR